MVHKKVLETILAVIQIFVIYKYILHFSYVLFFRVQILQQPSIASLPIHFAKKELTCKNIIVSYTPIYYPKFMY